jgi:hypothetical protein
MRGVRTIVAVIFVATIAVTGCAHTNSDQPAPPPPTPDTTHAPRPPTLRTDPTPDDPKPVDPTPVDRQAPIYAAVLRQYLTSGDHSFGDHRFPQVFVLDHMVAGAGAPGHEVPGGGPIPRAVQRAITHALTDVGPLTFVNSPDAVIEDHPCAHVRGDGILVTLGPVDGSGDRVQVGVNGFVACLGANSLTYLVERTGRGWAVSGITAHGPVA